MGLAHGTSPAPMGAGNAAVSDGGAAGVLVDVASWARQMWGDALVIWQGGGGAMIAIAVIALTMFSLGIHVWFRLRSKGFRSVPERTWRHWIEYPDAREGKIGELLDFVTGGSNVQETSFFFRQLRTNELPSFERELKVMRICVSTAPLVGLLGTVMGMLSTFAALSSGSGGDKTMGMVASGISEALITTETGLVVALPGLFFQYQLTRGFEAYKAFLAHLETVCMQTLHRRDAHADERAAKREALAVIARRLKRELRERDAREPALVGAASSGAAERVSTGSGSTHTVAADPVPATELTSYSTGTNHSNGV